MAWLLLTAYDQMWEQNYLKLELIFKGEAECKSLKNLQPGHMAEKESKQVVEQALAREISMNKRESSANIQNNGEKGLAGISEISEAASPTQVQRPRKKEWFCGPVPKYCCPVQLCDTAPCFLAAPAPALAQRTLNTAHAAALERASCHKPWWLPCGVKSVGIWIARVKVTWQLPPRFQRIYEKVWVPRQKPAAEVEPSWRTSTRVVRRVNVGLEPLHRVATRALPSRYQNDRSISSLHPASGKATNPQRQPVGAAVRAVPCKATGAELPKTLGANLLHIYALDMGLGIKGDYFGALRFDDSSAGFQTCVGPITPFFWPISPFWNGNVYPMPVLPLYLGIK
uniref:Uncharacterized protein n=1 Tax=Macaca fascicularis TaxID=9541 RepID=A0A7N9CXD9_MACFA